MGEAVIRPTAPAVASLILILSDINMPEISGLEPRSVKGLINGPDGPEIRLPLFPRKRTQVGHRAMSGSCQRTKSLRDSPLRGEPDREHGSRGQDRR